MNIHKTLAVGALIMAASCLLVAAPAFSDNVVGFIKIELAPKSTTLISSPFYPFFDDSIASIFEGQLWVTTRPVLLRAWSTSRRSWVAG